MNLTAAQAARIRAVFREAERICIRHALEAGEIGTWDAWCRLYNMGFRGAELARNARLQGHEIIPERPAA